MKIVDENTPKIITCELSMYAIIYDSNQIMVIVRGIYLGALFFASLLNILHLKSPLYI